MVAAMDAVGVDGAILISPFSLYGYDPSYILGVYGQHPGKFGLVRPFDPNSESIDQDVDEWTSTPGVVGCRIMLANQDYEADHPRPQTPSSPPAPALACRSTLWPPASCPC